MSCSSKASTSTNERRKESNEKKIYHGKITRCRKDFYDLSERQRSRLTAAIRATNKDDSNNEYFQAENSLDSDDEVIFEASSILNVQDNVNANSVNENPVDENVIHDTFSEIYDDRDRNTVDSQSDTDTDRIEIDEEEDFDTLQNFQSKLAEVFLSTNMSHVQGNAVLKVLRSHGCFSNMKVDIRILCRPSMSASDLSVAHSALSIFVNHAENIYGSNFMTYNTHCLLHLVEDVKHFGPLDSFSAFPYENNMTYFRRSCRKPHQHLQQITNRRMEFLRRKATRKNNNAGVKLSGRHKNGPLLSQLPVNVLQFSMYKTPDFCIGINDQDNTIILKDLSICVVRNIIHMNDEYCFLANIFSRVESLTDILVPSSFSGVFLCSSLSNELNLIQLPRINGKCFRMPYWLSEPAHNVDLPIPNVFVVASFLSTNN